MNLKSFLKLVEIQTKLASLIPFALGSLYASYHFGTFNIINFLVMFLSLFIFDMTTTAINNYIDFKKANKKHGFNYESHNAIVRYGLKQSTVLCVIISMLTVASLLGIYLVIRTNIIVLLVGMLSFAIGILYSFGPVPISRTPLGELMSGFFMGFVITFLSVYIHVYDMNIVTIAFENSNLSAGVNLKEFLSIFLLTIPLICGIANIMLANNICDIEDDIENRRYTLPIYIGRKNALVLFRIIYYIAYADILAMVILRIIPVTMLLVLLTLIPVTKNLKLFDAKQTKKDTFQFAVQNFFLLGGTQVIILGITIIIKYFIK